MCADYSFLMFTSLQVPGWPTCWHKEKVEEGWVVQNNVLCLFACAVRIVFRVADKQTHSEILQTKVVQLFSELAP